MLSSLLTVMLPVFLVVAVGFVVARLFTVDQLSLNKIQLYALTPALAYTSLMRTEVSFSDVGALGAGYFGSLVIVGLIAALMLRALPARGRRGAMASILLGNNGNFGLPIALLALGQAGLDQAIVIFMFAIVLMWTVGPAMFGGRLRPVEVFRNIFRLPVIWAMILALVLRLLSFEPPVGITRGIDMIADASIPMILLALGIQLGYSRRMLLNASVITAVLSKLLLVPAVGLGFSLLIGLRGLELQSVVLAMAMPSAVNVFLLALEFDGDSEQAASIVALSTLLSLVTISFVVANLPLLL